MVAFWQWQYNRKLNTAAQRFKISDEYRLNRLWGLASNFVTPLDPNGRRVWPNVGDSADFLLFNAESTAHVIARQQPIQQLILKGQLVEAVQRGKRMTASIVYLNNVRLETGFAKDHHELTYTKTARYTLAIQEGKIQAIIPQNQVTEKQQGTDLNGQLAIPLFKRAIIT